MNNFPERDLNPRDNGDVDVPGGLTVIRDLPNKFANEVLADFVFVHEDDWLVKIFDRAFQAWDVRERWHKGEDCHDEYVEKAMRVLFTVIECATEAGHSDYAVERWMEDEARCHYDELEGK